MLMKQKGTNAFVFQKINSCDLIRCNARNVQVWSNNVIKEDTEIYKWISELKKI
jgi:hypothetical protein